MGRRSTKTTKTGKFMNPTDQYRKQLRKKELKKNKQQRSAVREAVLKNKNPNTILAEIEEIEKMEIEAGQDQLPTEKGLKEKKRKLHETLQRIILFHERQNPQQAQKLKELVAESEKKRRAMMKVYNSYRSARSQIDVSDIPLPEGTISSIESTDVKSTDSSTVVPPAPPTGPPPDINFPKAITMTEEYSSGSDSDDSQSDNEDDDDTSNDEDDDSDNERIIPPPPPPGPPPTVYHQPLPLLPPPAPPQYHPSIPPHPLFNKAPPLPPVASQQQAPTISAQPQLRNVQAEVTKFMPTSLKVRRDQPKSVKAKMRSQLNNESIAKKSSSSKAGPGMQGDAYETFMAEMQGLL